MNKKLLLILPALIATVTSAYTPIVGIDGLVFLPEKALSRNFCEMNFNNTDCEIFRDYLRIVREATHLSQFDKKADEYLIAAYIDAYNGVSPNQELAKQINHYLINKATIDALLNDQTFLKTVNDSGRNLTRQAIAPNLTEKAFGQEHNLLAEAIENAKNNTLQSKLNYKSAQ